MYLSLLSTMHRGRALELQSLWQPFWPVKSTFTTQWIWQGCQSTDHLYSNLVTRFLPMQVKRGLSPEHNSLLEQFRWIQTAQPGPVCTEWTSPKHVGQQERGGSFDPSLVCPLVAAWDGRRSARSEHSYTMKYDRVTEYLTQLKQECSD